MGDLVERTVYVTGLHPKVTSELLEELFVQVRKQSLSLVLKTSAGIA